MGTKEVVSVFAHCNLFKKNVIDILIATDVAARDLSIYQDVNSRIKLDCSTNTYDILTCIALAEPARSGKPGTALTFVPA